VLVLLEQLLALLLALYGIVLVVLVAQSIEAAALSVQGGVGTLLFLVENRPRRASTRPSQGPLQAILPRTSTSPAETEMPLKPDLLPLETLLAGSMLPAEGVRTSAGPPA